MGGAEIDGGDDTDGACEIEGVKEGYSDGATVGSLVGMRLCLNSHLSISVIRVGYSGRSLHSRG